MNEARSKSGIALQSALLSRDLIVNSVLRSKDELANVAVFKWLLDNDLSNVVVEVIRFIMLHRWSSLFCEGHLEIIAFGCGHIS